MAAGSWNSGYDRLFAGQTLIEDNVWRPTLVIAVICAGPFRDAGLSVGLFSGEDITMGL